MFLVVEGRPGRLVVESMPLPPRLSGEGGVEGALADADAAPDALLGEEAAADEPVHRLAGDVGVELDVTHVEEQVGPCGLRSGYAREPLVVSLVLRGEAVLSEGGAALLRESERVSLMAHGRLRHSGGLPWPRGACGGLVRPRMRRL